MPLIVCGLAALVAACYSVDEIRVKPAVWTATYQAPFDDMATCITGHAADLDSVTPEVYSSKMLAYVTLSQPPYFPFFAQYQIDGTGAETVVSFRHITGGPGSNRQVERMARENADRCASQTASLGGATVEQAQSQPLPSQSQPPQSNSSSQQPQSPQRPQPPAPPSPPTAPQPPQPPQPR
jgi:hypothetical protein